MTTRSRQSSQLAVLVAVAMGLIAAAPTADAAAPTSARAKPNGDCLWPGRECYPPARLWYRVSVRLKAEREDNQVKPPTPASTGYEERVDWAQEWRLESRHAVRLTLMCADIGLREPFIDTARINGRRRKIGGCAPRRHAPFAPTVRFAAAATGEVTRHQSTAALGPFENADGSRCVDRWLSTRTLISAQPLVGSISAPGSSSVGVLISAEPTAPLATTHTAAPARECFDANGRPVPRAFGPLDFDSTFGPADTIGGNPSEGFFLGGSWYALYQLIRFPPRAANFGRRYVVARTVDQPELEPGSFPPPPPRLVTVHHQKHYTYTIRLEPCPNRGLDVKRC